MMQRWPPTMNAAASRSVRTDAARFWSWNLNRPRSRSVKGGEHFQPKTLPVPHDHRMDYFRDTLDREEYSNYDHGRRRDKVWGRDCHGADADASQAQGEDR